MYLSVFIGLTLLSLVSGKLVGFNAEVIDHRNVTADSVILYDTVHYNEGNAYDKTTGTFTVPTTGVYIISFGVQSQNSLKAWLALYRNGISVGAVFAHQIDNFDNGASTYPMPLVAGDKLQTTLGNCHFQDGGTVCVPLTSRICINDGLISAL